MIIRKLAHLKQSALNRVSLLKNRLQLPEKWKGGRVEKWWLFWEGLVLDYKGVASDVVQDAKTKPHKAFLVASGLGALFTAVKTNPDEQSFYDNLINCTTILTMVGDPIRNQTSEQHIQYLTRCQNQGLLRKTNLIFLTLMWAADYGKDCTIYASQCKYLKPRYITFHERIIDIGVFGIWWNMKLKMRDFDINANEWEEKT